MTKTEPQDGLYEQFKSWADGPDTALHRNKPAPMDALESGLWAAYCAGYEQALSDNKVAQRLMDFMSPKVR